MKSLVAGTILLACTSSLRSQVVASPAQSAAGVAEVRVRNRGAVSVAAFAIALNPSQKGDEVSPFVAFFDTVVDRTEPLQQDEERTVPVLLRLRPGTRLEEVFELPIITAGILHDGTTTGDAVLLTRLMLRRCNKLLAVENTIQVLSDAGKRNIARDQLIEEFRKMADSVWRWYVPPEQQVGRDLYRSIGEKLKQLPDQPVGSAFPPSAFVADQVRMLNRERVALLESQPNLGTATLSRAR